MALIPPEPVYADVQKLKEHMSDCYGSKGALRSPPHITLHMPFDWPDRKMEKLTDGLQSLAAGWPAVDVDLIGFGHFGERVIFIQVEASRQLITMQQSLRSAFRSRFFLLNDRYRDLPFHPHMTIGFRDLKPAAFRKAWQELGDSAFKASFRAAEIMLLKHTEGLWIPFRNFPLRNDTDL